MQVKKGLVILAMLGLTATLSTASASGALAATPPSAAALTAGYANAIQADAAASVYDPVIGREVWVTGDVTQVQGVNVQGGFGYPHGALLTEVPGQTTFTPLTFNTEKYDTDYWGYNSPNPAHYYQPWPNFSDGTYFWGTFIMYENGVIHVIGDHIQGVNPFTILGDEDVTLNAKTLMYQGVHQIPSTEGDTWSGYAKVTGGYWFTSQHGNAAFVPVGGIDTQWAIKIGAVPATSGSWPVQVGTGWDLFAAQAFVKPINEYHATTITGPWSGPTQIGTMTYDEVDGGIWVHTDLPAPAGQYLMNWDENQSATVYDPEFFYANK